MTLATRVPELAPRPGRQRSGAPAGTERAAGASPVEVGRRSPGGRLENRQGAPRE